jgi:catechol-2,3-dioxygenase
VIPITRLNHAVLFVRDVRRSVAFYRDVLGFTPVSEMPGAAFLRAGGSDNHHDLGLFEVGPGAPAAPRGAPGLYHLAWEVPTIEDLALAAETLRSHGALGGASDHGVSKSLYGKDPDGHGFEILWVVPRADWGAYAADAAVLPLDLARELARYGATGAKPEKPPTSG